MAPTRRRGAHLETDDAFCGKLAARLEERRGVILKRALAEGCGNPELPRAQEMGAAQLRDQLPKLLDRLAAHLRGAPRVGLSLAAPSSADAHGPQCWGEHYRLHELVRELGVVERVVLREALNPLVTKGTLARVRLAASARERVRGFLRTRWQPPPNALAPMMGALTNGCAMCRAREGGRGKTPARSGRLAFDAAGHRHP